MNDSVPQIKIAILDLYEGHDNQGMRCIRTILKEWSEVNDLDIVCNEFDIRKKNEIPDLNYDIFISTGGPGSPLDTTETLWEQQYFNWLSLVEEHNNNILNSNKKRVFFICHSFQIVCRHYNIGTVSKRGSTSFGVFPVHLIGDAKDDIIFDGLKDPFYVVDSRDYQVIEPNYTALNAMGASVLAIEKNRPHVAYERAIMAVRFNDYFVGTQFHPEADAGGMSMYLQKEDRKATVIQNHSEAKWKSMVEQLQDPDKILATYSHILPNFLNTAIEELA